MHIIFLGIGIKLPDPNAEAFWFHSRGLQNSLSVRHESFSHLLLMLIVLQTCDRDFFFKKKKFWPLWWKLEKLSEWKPFILLRYTHMVRITTVKCNMYMKNKNLMPFIFTIRNFIVLIKWFPRIISFIVFFIVIDYILAHSERIAVTFSSWTARGVVMKLFVLWFWTIFSFLSFFRVCEKSSKTWNSWRFPRPGGFILSLFKVSHYIFSKIVNQIFFWLLVTAKQVM